MKCYQCPNNAMWSVTERNIPLCLECYLKFSQIQQAEMESNERWLNYLSDEMASITGMPSLAPRFPPRPRPVHISGVKLNNINVSNSVIGTLNTGNIGTIDQSISALVQVGEPSVAEALKELSQAIICSRDLTVNQKNELVEIMSVVASEAASPKEKRKSAVVKSLLDRASQITALATDITGVCQKWWPILLQVFSWVQG